MAVRQSSGSDESSSVWPRNSAKLEIYFTIMKVCISTLEENKDDVTDIVYKLAYFLKNNLINGGNTQLKYLRLKP